MVMSFRTRNPFPFSWALCEIMGPKYGEVNQAHRRSAYLMTVVTLTSKNL